MPFRQRAKAFFKRSKTNDDTLSKTDSSDSHERWPSNVYKPGEPMPRPKYRQPPKKEHKEHLESFSFADAWRRKSFQSQYSPMGTRAPSRLPSAAPSRRSSWYSRKKSLTYSRSGSVTSVDTQKSSGEPKRRMSQSSKKTLSRGPSMRDTRREYASRVRKLSTEPEQEGDDDVFNGKNDSFGVAKRIPYLSLNVLLIYHSRHVSCTISRAQPALTPALAKRRQPACRYLGPGSQSRIERPSRLNPSSRPSSVYRRAAGSRAQAVSSDRASAGLEDSRGDGSSALCAYDHIHAHTACDNFWSYLFGIYWDCIWDGNLLSWFGVQSRSSWPARQGHNIRRRAKAPGAFGRDVHTRSAPVLSFPLFCLCMVGRQLTNVAIPHQRLGRLQLRA